MGKKAINIKHTEKGWAAKKSKPKTTKAKTVYNDLDAAKKFIAYFNGDVSGIDRVIKLLKTGKA